MNQLFETFISMWWVFQGLHVGSHKQGLVPAGIINPPLGWINTQGMDKDKMLVTHVTLYYKRLLLGKDLNKQVLMPMGIIFKHS